MGGPSGTLGPRDFVLIIGAMKSGTTTLFELLAQHPEIAAASVKEPSYFAETEVWEKGWDWYVGLWDWNPKRHRIALEASTAYTTFPARPGVPKRIAGVPEARFRFVYILRHPLRQIASNVRHTLYAGWGRPLDDGIPSWMIDTVRYARQIDEYRSFFPAESMFLVTLEEFQQEPTSVLRRLCRFLDVDEDYEFSGTSERYNAGDAYEIPAFWARLVKAAPARWIAARTLPRNLRHRIRALLPRLLGQGAPLGRYTLTEREKATVLEQLGPDIQRLEQVYGVDVGKYWSIEMAGSSEPRGV